MNPTGALPMDSGAVRDVLSLIDRNGKRQAAKLLAALTVMSIVEVAGILSIMPFLGVLADPSVIDRNAAIAWLYSTGGFEGQKGFLFFLGVLALAILVIGNTFSAYTTWKLYNFVYEQEHQIGVRLLRRYISRPYSFFITRNSTELSKNLLTEVSQVVNGGLLPLLQAAAKGATVVAIGLALIVIDPFLAMIALLTVGVSYWLIYAKARGALGRYGRERLTASQERFKAAGETFAGIKEIKVGGYEDVYLGRFAEPSAVFASQQARYKAINQLPRYLIETLAFGGMLLMILYLLASRQSLDAALPLIGLYVFAGYRLIPAIQQVFAGLTSLRFFGSAAQNLHHELYAPDRPEQFAASTGNTARRMRSGVELDGVTYCYPDAAGPAVRDISLRIPTGHTVAFVGQSGSGKTTTADIVLGLLQPQQGLRLIDGEVIDQGALRYWRRSVAYVPQQIFLSDSTVAENIALGRPMSEVDFDAVARAADTAGLKEFIEDSLPDGYHTVIGEHGVRLSGGERQRIGIARALYRQPSLLIIDEATSALDAVTEAAVLRGIWGMAAEMGVVVISHRLAAVMNCDHIYVFENGRITDHGTYTMLIDRCDTFRSLVLAGRDRHSAAPGEYVR